ncbi:MAG: MarR family winged helix-turn-helix transcriptional regulator [Trebonia sp.]
MMAVTDLPAKPPEPNAAVLLVALGRRARVTLDEALASYQIGYRHLSALGHLAASEEISYSDLARRASVTAQSMRATLAHLEDLGIVERTGAAGQGKRARLTVTPEGRRLLADCRATLADAEAEILAGLAPGRRELLRELLAETFISTSPVRSRAAPAASDRS